MRRKSLIDVPILLVLSANSLARFLKKRLLKHMPELIELTDKHYGPSIITVSAKFTVLLREKKWEELEALWRSFPSLRMRPTTQIFNIMIQSSRYQGRPERAFKYYENMIRAGHQPDAHSISILLGLYVH